MATLTSKLIVELFDRVTGPARRVSAALNGLTAASARNSARLSAISGKLLGTGAAAFALGQRFVGSDKSRRSIRIAPRRYQTKRQHGGA